VAEAAMSRPRLLDLFCGQGGAAMGYRRAGFDVVGVDIEPQPRYPFEFHQADALAFVAAHGHEFDAIHASPPCQAYSVTRSLSKRDHPELVEPTRAALFATVRPYVIENVPGAPLIHPLVLCGTEFGLRSPSGHWVRRHRLFESNVFLYGAGHCHCAGKLTAYTTGHPPAETTLWKGWQMGRRDSAVAFDIDWMSGDGLVQAIPPAYTEFVGEQLLAHLNESAA
jgi:DNA (cytosine-5)-methyltransferase 1